LGLSYRNEAVGPVSRRQVRRTKASRRQASRQGSRDFGAFEIDHGDRPLVVIADQHGPAVGMERHVHRPSSELDDILGVEIGVEDRREKLAVAGNDQLLAIGAVLRNLRYL
jgi:hypothetical protein